MISRRESIFLLYTGYEFMIVLNCSLEYMLGCDIIINIIINIELYRMIKYNFA